MVRKEDSIYAPPQDPEGFDARLDEDENRGPMLLVVAIAVLLALAAVVYTAYHQGLRKGGRDAAPHVTAPDGSLKVRPKESHGKPTPNLDNKAYEPLDDIKTAPTTSVKTAPLPEEPLPRSTPSPAVTQKRPVAAPPPPVRAKPKPAPVKPKPAPVKAKPAPVQARTGKYMVQIASFRSKQQALTAWRALRAKMPNLLGGKAADVQRADLGSKGVYYRLRAASFADRNAASAFCTALKKNGQNCLVVSR